MAWSVTPCPLPFRSLVTLFQTTKVTSHLQLQHSKDVQVKSTLSGHKTGRKWSTEAALNTAQSRLNHQQIVGDVRGSCRKNSDSIINQRGGLGLVPPPKVSEGDGKKDHRQLISKALEEQRDEELMIKAVNQSVQGAWTRWKQFVQRDMSWKSLLGAKSNLVRFCIGSTFDTLSTPNNLHRWGIIDNPKCNLCDQEGCGILHILTACDVAFQQKRFTYRHNQILRCIADGIQSFLNTNKITTKGIQKVHFVPESGSAKEKKSRKPVFGLLHHASDFKLSVDLDKQMKYPVHIADSLKRPDIVLYSDRLKTVIHIELTSPGEDKFQISYDKKFLSYCESSELGAECVANGWKVHCFPVEVGCRGYVADSLPTCLRKLGLGKVRSRKICKEAGDAALRASFWIWVLRDRKQWDLSSGFTETSPGILTKATNVALGTEQVTKDPQDQRINNRPRGKRKYPEAKRVVQDTLAKKKQTNVTMKSPRRPKQQEKTRVPSGLTNVGNSCYMNSVLQCLFNIAITMGNISEATDSNSHHTDTFSVLFEEWKSSIGKCVNPQVFKTTMGALCPKFNNCNQQDAHEWMTTIIYALRKTPLIGGIIKQISGKFLSVVECDACFTPYEQNEPFNCMELPLLPSLSQAVLVELLAKFEDKEVIPVTRQRQCPGCKQIASATRCLSVSDTGDWLVISIKRFVKVANQLHKNKRWVSYPLTGLAINNKMFDLYGIVSHSGTCSEGHYTASVRSGKIWYTCNDAVIQRVSQAKAASFNKEVYILFYTKQ